MKKSVEQKRHEAGFRNIRKAIVDSYRAYKSFLAFYDDPENVPNSEHQRAEANKYYSMQRHNFRMLENYEDCFEPGLLFDKYVDSYELEKLHKQYLDGEL